jgi:hypothetical protein
MLMNSLKNKMNCMRSRDVSCTQVNNPVTSAPHDDAFASRASTATLSSQKSKGLRLLSASLIAGLCLTIAHPASKAQAQSALYPLQNVNVTGSLVYNQIKFRWMAAWMKMANQFSANMMHQMFIMGSFFDAKHQLETQRLFALMTFEAQRDYTPGDQICRFGTNVRSLAADEQIARANAQIISSIMMNRELIPAETTASHGRMTDRRARLYQFKKTYCNVNEFMGKMKEMCVLSERHDGEVLARTAPDARTNRDVNFLETVFGRLTLDVDFTDTVLTDDEEDVLALGRNLFAHNIFDRIPQPSITQDGMRERLVEMRSITALRGLARNTYGHIVGQRARGHEDVTPFVHGILSEMGVPDEDLESLIGKNPSYFAQMEVLTRLMYQNPTFYTNLYDKPTNVARTAVAMQAIQLMNDRDRYEAAQRREMLLAGILELRLRVKQDRLVNELLNYSSLLPDNTDAGEDDDGTIPDPGTQPDPGTGTPPIDTGTDPDLVTPPVDTGTAPIITPEPDPDQNP